jgi:hypothetical protein
MIRFRIPMVALFAALLATTAIASAQSVTLASGTQLYAKMDTTLDSANAYYGQRFTMHLTAPYASSALQGGYITGHVIKVVHAKQGVKPELQLAFDQLVLSNGTATDINAQMTSSQSKKSTSNLGHSALTALGGMLIGNAIGKTIFHTSAGGAIGLAGGALYGLNAKTNFNIPAGSSVTVTTTHQIVIRRQAHK